MAIKPVTFQGEENFKSNLYALEVKSRFIDQTHADGYYKGYGDELAATAKTGAITVGSGALVVQGRMIEIETGGADCAVDVSTNRVGYVCVRIETYHLTDSDNVTLVSKLGASLSAITFTQQDTYAAVSETVNRIYELPIYSFAVQNGIITNLVKLINPVEDYATIKALADAASNNASAAAGNAQSAASNATLAQSAANNAASLAAEAKTNAENALAAAQEALTKVVEDMGGTVIYKDGVAIATLEIDIIAKAITYAFECGEAEKARGYTRGGELDRALRRLSQRVMSANFALYADESETARKAQGYTVGGAIDRRIYNEKLELENLIESTQTTATAMINTLQAQINEISEDIADIKETEAAQLFSFTLNGHSNGDTVVIAGNNANSVLEIAVSPSSTQITDVAATCSNSAIAIISTTTTAITVRGLMNNIGTLTVTLTSSQGVKITQSYTLKATGYSV